VTEDPKFIFRVHAMQRMFERGISELDIRLVVEEARVVEDYPTEQPFPMKLLLGWSDRRPVHVLACFDVQADTIIIVTVYEPTLERWLPGFLKRR
jgi:hypothetical protein